jgi:predicted DNA-binding transcriptional regulator AlpA
MMSNPAKPTLPNIDLDDRVLPLREVADAADISVVTLRRRIADGSGPKLTRVSDRRVGVRGRHYREWLDTQCAKPGPRAI